MNRRPTNPASFPDATYASDAADSSGTLRTPRPVANGSVEADILLLGEPGLVEPLRTRLGRRQTVAFDDPYDAILSLHEQPCRCVVVTATQPELPGLCRALRRVHGKGTLLAMGGPAGEPAMRSLTPSVLDDYVIAPPTPADVERIRGTKSENRISKSQTTFKASNGTPKTARPAEALYDEGVAAHTDVRTSPPRPYSTGEAMPRSAPTNGHVSLTTAQWAELLAVTGVSGLRQVVVRLLSSAGLSAAWRRAEELPATHPPLLTLDGEDGSLCLAAAEPHTTPPAAATELLAVLGPLLGPLAKNGARIESLHKLATTDHLTGAYNRRYFYHLTEQILARADQADFRVTLLLYDIDDFKHYNETYGHAAGDEILRQTAALMKKTSRAHDIVARIGGDEFAVLFWDTDPPRSPDSKPLESFVELAERFRQAVRDHSFPFLGPDAKGTLSISGGLAHFPAQGKTCLDLLRAADTGLRTAKRQGKDRIFLVGK